jgi:ornithine cyclodeaminase/alanine dehydrogenase-like protein (mu-crystallin family)
MKIRYLSEADVRASMPGVQECLDLCQDALEDIETGAAVLPPKPSIDPRDEGYFHPMAAWMKRRDVVGVKWIAGFSTNKALGLPNILGVAVLSDPATGAPLCIMSAGELTARRTACV